VARGKTEPDLILENVRILNVYTEEIEWGSLVISKGKIVAINPEREWTGGEKFDGQGLYALPGLIDAHLHIEPTLLTPEALSSLTVPQGTTVLFADFMEIANVAGRKGIEALLAGCSDLPCRIYMQVPSRVPTAPGLETTGGQLGAEEVEQLLKDDRAISLGELDPAKILNASPEHLEKIGHARRQGKIINGHAIGLDWNDLNTYAAAGIGDDHECVEFDELKNRLRLGMTVMIREGSTERNLEELIKGVIREGIRAEHLIFCTDDKHPHEIKEEGHINYNVNRAIALGMDPVKAIKMATLNSARHFRLDHSLGSLAPGRYADIILVENLEKIDPVFVFCGGELVVGKGEMLKKNPINHYPHFLYNSVKIPPDLGPYSFKIPAENCSGRVRVIDIYPDQIINKEGEARLTVVEGYLKPDPAEDVLTLAVVERYGKQGNVGLGFVRGFGLKQGALAISVAHDHHNVVVVGGNEEDMDMAVKEVGRMGGGMAAVADAAILQTLPLPLGGLMSDRPAPEVLEGIRQMNETAKSMGCFLPAPFMTLSFISLPTVPQLGITDLGLIEVKTQKIISPVLD